jgi:hypothetical protein
MPALTSAALVPLMAMTFLSAPPPGAGITQCPLPAAGRTAVTGVLVDEDTRVPLRGAEVTVTWQGVNDRRPSTATATTGASGRFEFCDVPAGMRLRIQARWIGFNTSRDENYDSGTTNEIQLVISAPHSTLSGRVLEAGTTDPVPAAEVRVAGTPLVQTTRADGRFSFLKVPPGDYVLEVSHIGFEKVTDSLRVAYASNVDVAVKMTTAAIALQPIEVNTRLMHLDRVGFYERKDRGLGGSYISRDQIERMLPTLASDLLRTLPGITLVPRPNNYGFVALGRGGCAFRYIIDGGRTLGDYTIDDLQWDWIEALEVYRGPADVPGEFTSHTSSERANCGVIVVWTRRRAG